MFVHGYLWIIHEYAWVIHGYSWVIHGYAWMIHGYPLIIHEYLRFEDTVITLLERNAHITILRVTIFRVIKTVSRSVSRNQRSRAVI